MVPATAGNPIAFFVLGDGFSQTLLQFFRRGDAIEAQGNHLRPGGAKMDVGVVETGHDKFFFELHGFRVGIIAAALQKNAVELPDATDFPRANGHGFRPGLRGVVRVDSPVKIDRGVWNVLRGMRIRAKREKNCE